MTHTTTTEFMSRCALCDEALEGKPDQCITDCGHVFCVSCACRYLGHNKNRCSECHIQVKIVRQMDACGNEAQREKPCSVKFCNVTYILYVSIWSVDDPTHTLATLFHLDHARLIHHGKILKKGDVWPGSVVQLVGTKKSVMPSDYTSNGASTCSTSSTDAMLATVVSWAMAIVAFVMYPLKLIYLFFHSMVRGEEYQSLPQRRYAPVDATEPSTAPVAPTFEQPGIVPLPPRTDTVE
ncbi:hypothetical protein H310_00703 [Aphanomyces invadans]|uniref:RING-type domain-containing protein n=1 Tax=Aphanomyces invadans TaxID=157072 RepID=A0A024UWP7_9STRA|nr:hypothetical protein H310_00703 [Aphanomyces invadans]ETW10385.1 hypothetical protein H310_00703 [Aphanomyces invadans]|eukprot:XP_008861796.1 hypothetical protein H310_00703 [Aphanomyces invadans]